MTQAIDLLVIPVKDLARARAAYQALLGAPPYVDSPYYVGFRLGEQELGLDPGGSHTRPTPYRRVADLEQSIERLVAAGFTVDKPPHDVGGGQLIALLRDPDGHVFGLRK